MIIVLKQHAPADKVQAFCNELNGMGFQINDSVGSDTHILGLIGDTKALAEKMDNFIQEAPFKYTLRDDFIRAVAGFDAKLDKILDQLTKRN